LARSVRRVRAPQTATIQLDIHINVKEHLTTWWDVCVFGDIFPGVYAHEWIDNKVSIYVGAAGKSTSEALRRIQKGRHAMHRNCAWVARQDYIPTDLNKIADAFSRDRLDLAAEALESRGLALEDVIRLEIPPEFRDVERCFGLISLAAQA